jgi:hypothetical protein
MASRLGLGRGPGFPSSLHAQSRACDTRPVIAIRNASWLAIGLAACLPSAALEPAVLVTHDCRGPFTAEVPVVKRGVRKLAVVYELTPGDYNVADIARTPERETIAGKQRRSKIDVRGHVVDPCEDAGLNVFASYVPGGHAGFVGIPSAIAAAGLQAAKADPSDGTFAYPIEITCCRAGSHPLRVKGLDNVDDVRAEPHEITCEGTEQHLVAIRGRVAARDASARVEVEIDGGANKCTVTDEITVSAPD